jgi:hypothetical protein
MLRVANKLNVVMMSVIAPISIKRISTRVGSHFFTQR